MVKLSQYALGCRNTVGDGWFRMQFQSAAAIARRTCIVPKLRWWCHWTSGNNHVKVFYKCNLFTSQNDQSSTTRPGVGYWRNYWNSVNWWNRRTTWRSSSRCTGRGNVLLIKLSLVWSWWWCDVVLNRISFLHARPDSFCHSTTYSSFPLFYGPTGSSRATFDTLLYLFSYTGCL